MRSCGVCRINIEEREKFLNILYITTYIMMFDKIISIQYILYFVRLYTEHLHILPI